MIWLDREGAEAAARAADKAVRARRTLGLLHGVPMAHKDMYYQEGKLSTCGSALRRDFRPTVTATVIARMAEAGAYTFAGLNMAEFAQNLDRPQQDLWRLSQSVEPALYHRRLVVRFGGIRRGAFQLYGTRVGHRRIDPASRLRLRGDGAETDADPGVPLWRHAAVILARQCWPARSFRARLRLGC